MNFLTCKECSFNLKYESAYGTIGLLLVFTACWHMHCFCWGSLLTCLPTICWYVVGNMSSCHISWRSTHLSFSLKPHTIFFLPLHPSSHLTLGSIPCICCFFFWGGGNYLTHGIYNRSFFSCAHILLSHNLPSCNTPCFKVACVFVTTVFYPFFEQYLTMCNPIFFLPSFFVTVQVKSEKMWVEVVMKHSLFLQRCSYFLQKCTHTHVHCEETSQCSSDVFKADGFFMLLG